jgi:hypothetical protein
MAPLQLHDRGCTLPSIILHGCRQAACSFLKLLNWDQKQEKEVETGTLNNRVTWIEREG